MYDTQYNMYIYIYDIHVYVWIGTWVYWDAPKWWMECDPHWLVSRRFSIAELGLLLLLWMEEILHQLIDGKHPIICRVSTIQGGAGFRNHPQY